MLIAATSYGSGYIGYLLSIHLIPAVRDTDCLFVMCAIILYVRFVPFNHMQHTHTHTPAHQHRTIVGTLTEKYNMHFHVMCHLPKRGVRIKWTRLQSTTARVFCVVEERWTLPLRQTRFYDCIDGVESTKMQPHKTRRWAKMFAHQICAIKIIRILWLICDGHLVMRYFFHFVIMWKTSKCVDFILYGDFNIPLAEVLWEFRLQVAYSDLPIRCMMVMYGHKHERKYVIEPHIPCKTTIFD